MTVYHSSRTNNSLQNQTIFRRNIFLPNVRCPFVQNSKITDRAQNKNSKTYTYYYGENHTLQNLPYIQELSFSNNIFKNIYYCSTQEDLKNIEDKIGRDPDPLHNHQYFKSIISLKTFKFNERGTKFLKANCDRTLQCTHGRTKVLNYSKAHSEERGDFQKCRSEPTAELKDSNYLKNSNSEGYG